MKTEELKAAIEKAEKLISSYRGVKLSGFELPE